MSKKQKHVELHIDMDDKLTKSLCVRIKEQSGISDKCVTAIDWLTRKNKWVVSSLDREKQSCVHRSLTS